MTSSPPGEFLRGLAAGILAGLAVLLIVIYLPQISADSTFRDDAIQWISANLGLSIFPFALTLLLFRLSLYSLERRLKQAAPLHRIAQADQLTDIWIGLFFGIGVLWTAIGMRSALLFALGDSVDALSNAGAAGLLERLVRGGILTALTTTIVGGAGGYLLRLYKTLRVGGRLKRYYVERERMRELRVEELLREIRDGIAATGKELEQCR